MTNITLTIHTNSGSQFMTNITLTIHTATESTESIRFNARDAQPIRIQAQHHVNYELVDEATGFAPEPIDIKRVGNDLHVTFEDSGASNSESDLVIEGYYDEEGTNLLIGLHENGNIYTYVPVSGEVEHAFSQLAEEIIAPHVLGGEALKGAAWAFHPGWLLALVPAAVLIASGGSSGRSGTTIDINKPEEPKDTTAPAAPKVVANDDGSVSITPASDEDTSSIVVNYVDENGESQRVTFEKGGDGQWKDNDPTDDITIDSVTGVVTIPEEAVKDGSTVTATNSDASGNDSEPSSAVAKDVTPPDAPTVVIDEAVDGFLSESEVADGIQTVVSLPEGTEAGDVVTVVIRGPEGHEETVEYTVKPEDVAKGSVAIVIPADKVAGDGDYSAVAVVTDKAGNRSDESGVVEFEVDTTVELPTLVINAITADNVINADEADGQVLVTGSVAGGEFSEGDQVTLTINGKEYTAGVDADGNWSVEVEGSDLAADTDSKIAGSVLVKDAAGNTATVTADKEYGVDLTPPTITITDGITGDDFITATEKSLPLEISGTTDAEAGRVVTVWLATGKSYTSEVDAAGNWSVTVPAEDVAQLPEGSRVITAEVSDIAGNTAVAEHTITVDSVVPTVEIEIVSETLNIDNAESEVIITFTEVPYGDDGEPLTAEEVKALLNISSSNVELSNLTTDDDKTWTATLTAIQGTARENITISISQDSYYDQAGNVGEPNSGSVVVDTQAPTITLNDIGDGNLSRDEATKLTLSGATEGVETGQEVTLTITDANNKSVVFKTTVNSDGTYSREVNISAGLAEGKITVTAEVTDQAGNSADPANKEATLDTIAPTISIDAVAENNIIDWSEKTSENGFEITGTTEGVEDGQEVTLTFYDKNGEPLLDNTGAHITVTTQVTENKWIVNIPQNIANQLKDGTVHANVTDMAGNPAPTVTEEYEVAPPPAPVIDGYFDSVDYVQGSNVANGAINGAITVEGQIKGRFGEILAGFSEKTETTDYGTFEIRADGSWTYIFNESQEQVLRDSNAPLNDDFIVTADGKSYEVQVSIHELYSKSGEATVTATTVALKEEGKIENSQQEGWLEGTEGGDKVVTGISVVGAENVGGAHIFEVFNQGKLTFFENGSYIFEPYDDNISLTVNYTVDGVEKQMVVSSGPNDVVYSNDVLGRITGTVDEALANKTATLRLYVNKENTGDGGTTYQGITYRNGADVEVSVDTDGRWEITPKQLRDVLKEIWWADKLRGDDEIYLEVKLVDPVTGKASETSNKYTFVADTYPPQPTNVEFDPKGGEYEHGLITALVWGDMTALKEPHADPGDLVTVTYDGKVIAEGTVGDFAAGYGSYLEIAISLTKEQHPATGTEEFDLSKLKVHVTDKAGNTGTSDDGEVEPFVGEALPKPIIEAYIDNVAGGIEGGDPVGHNGITNDNAGAIRGTVDMTSGNVNEVWVYVSGLGPIRVVPDESGSWIVTSEQLGQLTTTTTLQDGAVTVIARAYNAASNVISEVSETFVFTVDTVAPTVEVNIVKDSLNIADDTSEVTFKFSEEPVGFELSDIEVTGGQLSDLVQNLDNPLWWTATFTSDPSAEGIASVTVPAGRFTDKAGNSNVEDKSDTVAYDTKAPTVTITIDNNIDEHDVLIASTPGTLTISFSEVPHNANGEALTSAEIKELLVTSPTGGRTSGLTILDLGSSDGGKTWIAELYAPAYVGPVTVTLPEGSYFDALGNTGSAGIATIQADTQHPVGVDDFAEVTEQTARLAGNLEVTNNVLANDKDGSEKVVSFSITVDGVVISAKAGESITTKYGTITITETGDYTYNLDNDRQVTKQLNRSDAPVEEITYIMQDKYGNEGSATLHIIVNGNNDAPIISLETPSEQLTITSSGTGNLLQNGGNNGDGSFDTSSRKSPTANGGNQDNSSTQTLNFNVTTDVDPSTVRAVINLDEVDNSFSILVNGIDIYTGTTNQTIFQLETGGSVNRGFESNAVALRFADGTWLGAGAPWNANIHGLPRFQIILTEDSVRFYATKSTNSEELEEIFIGTNTSSTNFDTVFPNGLTNLGLKTPDFNVGQNTVTVINPNGAGQDFMKGYMTVTTGGSFAINDWDDDYVSSATITLEGTKPGDKLTAVLPFGIEGTETTVNGNLVLTLSGNASRKDYEDAIGSVMFQAGAATGERTIQIQLTDESGESSNVLEGTLYAGTRSLEASGQASIKEWTDAGFKVAGYTTANQLIIDNKLNVNESLKTSLDNSTGVFAQTRSNNGYGIGVGSSNDNVVISGNEHLVIDVGFNATGNANLTLKNFTRSSIGIWPIIFYTYETAQWYAYDKTGGLVGSGSFGSGSNTSNNSAVSATLEINAEYRYLVLKAADSSSNFVVDGLTVQGNTTSTIGEFDFSASSGVQGASLDIENFAAPMAMSMVYEDDVDLELTVDSDRNSSDESSNWIDDLDNYVAGTSLLDTEDEAFVLIGDKVQHITDDGISNISEYAGVEEIHLDGSVHFDLSYSDLLGSQDPDADTNPLKIFGGEDDILDFGNNGPDALSDEEGRYADGDNEDAEDYGSWLKNGTVDEEGVTFDVYEYHSSASAGGDADTKNQVLVQQGIEVI
ncbi:VCBS repeat [Oligella ureolytica]|uniref:Ig-like domain-containing protein n=1 Tax=Oligella ureolytica TaxID=90244 RepID=UPI000E0745DB|nr:Ig-like domain-containing protein [Oligella ureolytica]SUA55932.1 VCBS repeat [Oligella ureolytica]